MGRTFLLGGKTVNGVWIEIGERVREKRREKRYTHKDMGDFLNLSAFAYRRREEGKRCFSIDQILTMCAMFSVNPGWLLTGKGENDDQ